jgi:RHS repeat-associated protein
MKIDLPVGVIIGGLSLSIALLNIESPKQPDYSGGYMPSARVKTTHNPIHDKGDNNSLSVYPLSFENQPNTSHPEQAPANAADEAGTAAFACNFGEASISGEAGALSRETELTISGLETRELPPLEQGMVNVTGDYAAYRMLPHGTRFNSDIDIVLPYDTALLPIGYAPNDIMTYYYDELRRQWIMIPRDTVDEANRLIYSKVNHFTDFINAIIKSPEMPETQAYTPTSIKDLKAANPLEGINLIQPPTANNSGTANLSYPIDIPAGRQGMQPSLAVTYSSSGGNGWLGVGWDISIPAITVETRWGVPRYDASQESEVYLYQGEQLVNKKSDGHFQQLRHRTNGNLPRLSGNIQFYPRVEEAFDKIVRHGYSPQTYWWEVTDRHGITYIYGKYIENDNIGAVLRDDAGNIAHWALTEIRDPHGNAVRYYYNVVTDFNNDNHTNPGRQIYLSRINYTDFFNGSGYEKGKYSLLFNLSDTRRKDVAVSGRYGFKEVSARLLCSMAVMYEDTVIQMQYAFQTENNRNSQYKTRLKNLIGVNQSLGTGYGIPYNACDTAIFANMENSDNNSAWTKFPMHYRFEYYDYPEAEALYAPAVTYEMPKDRIMSFFASPEFNLANVDANAPGRATALGASRGFNGSVGGTAGVGFGPDVVSTFLNIGGNFNYTGSTSEGLLTLIDLDGDGFQDKVFKKNNKLYYRKQHFYSNDNISFGEPVALSGVKRFLKENSHDIAGGLQGAIGVDFSASWPTTNTHTTVYFADVNGDGLPDIVDDKEVWFNFLVDGVPTFSPLSRITTVNLDAGAPSPYYVAGPDDCGGIIFDGEVSPEIDCRVVWKPVDKIRWTYMPSVEAALSQYFQTHNITDTASYLWSYCMDSNSNYYTGVTTWNPCYTGYNRDFFYLFKKTVVCTPELIDPDIEAVKVWIAPRSGYVSLTSAINMAADSSESFQQASHANGVRYCCQLNRGVGLLSDADYILTSRLAEELFTGYLPKTGFTPRNDISEGIWVSAGDIIFFRLQSQGDHSFDRVNWDMSINYAETDLLRAGDLDEYGGDATRYNAAEDYVLTDKKYFQAVKAGTVALSGTIKAEALYHSVLCKLYKGDSVIHSFYMWSGDSVNLEDMMPAFAVDSQESLSFKVYIDDYVAEATQAVNTTWSSIQGAVKIKLTANFTGDLQDSVIYHILPELMIDNYKGTKLDTVCHALFGPLYRGWGQFAYNNTYTSGSDAELLDISSLKVPVWLVCQDESQIDSASLVIDSAQLTSFDNAEINTAFSQAYNPLDASNRWVEMTPNPVTRRWTGYSNTTYITATEMSNTRIPLTVTQPAGTPADSVADENGNMAAIPVTGLEIEIYNTAVPVSVNGTPVKTVRKSGKIKKRNHALNASLPYYSMGTSGADGKIQFTTDYMDMNGDGYPDIIGEAKIQYSTPWGGIGQATTDITVADACGASYSNTYSEGSTYGGTYYTPVNTPHINPKNGKVTFESKAGGGASYSNEGGHDEVVSHYMDVNGDGLPDKVFANGDVCLNMGYRFLRKEKWNSELVRTGRSKANGGALSGGGGTAQEMGNGSNSSFGTEAYSFGGGHGITFAENSTESALMDMNGDGIPDQVTRGTDKITVKYSLGNGVWSATDEIDIPDINKGTSFSEFINGAFTAGFTFFGWFKINVGINAAPYNQTFTKERAQITDFNNDGYPDFLTSEAESELTVRYHTGGKTNLLKRVTNCTGSMIVLDYELPNSSYEHPQRNWVMSSVKTIDPTLPAEYGANNTLTKFEYYHPRYNRYERLEFGFDSVIIKQYDTENGNALYRCFVDQYNNTFFNRRGKLTRQFTCNAAGSMYMEKLYDIQMADLLNGQPADDGECPGEIFPNLETEITHYYEGSDQIQLATAISRNYDMKRNIIHWRYYSNYYYSELDRYADISYAQNMSHNLIALPVSIEIKDGTSQLMRKRTATYNSTGRPTQIRQYGTASAFAQTDLYYDQYGNLNSRELPPNHNGQRMSYSYEYDEQLHQYPVKITDALGHQATAEYDFLCGKPVKTTDINGSTIRYKHDGLGRVTEVLAPSEAVSNAPYTLRMKYQTSGWPGLFNYETFTCTENPVNVFQYAITCHYSASEPCHPIVTVMNVDGFGRPLQMLKNVVVNGQDYMQVSGKVKYDAFGRIIARYDPVLDNHFTVECRGGEATGQLYSQYAPPAPALTNVFNPYYSYDPIAETLPPPETVTYDILDRPVTVQDPISNITQHQYGFVNCAPNRKCYYETTADANGNLATTLLTPTGERTRVSVNGNTVATFAWNGLGELLASTDAENFTTTYQYDMLGRCTQRTHPDAGTDRYEFDKAGNLTARQTQKLINSGSKINYAYHYNRLTDITYPENPQNNVHYTYGEPNNPAHQIARAMGRIFSQTDASGGQTFVYDALGNVTLNYRIFALPYEPQTYTFITMYEYDSWNRIKSITYPDFEKVSYAYNRAGNLIRVTGTKDEERSTYISNISYDKFERKARVEYGNNTQASYDYDELGRLKYLASITPSGTAMQKLSYTYDPVSNITKIENTASETGGMGGYYRNEYKYDDLYRLIWSGGGSKSSYSLSMEYSPNGKILQKWLTSYNNLYGQATETDYRSDYAYASGTNKLQLVQKENFQLSITGTQTFNWDANGNMINHNTAAWKYGYRTSEWDEENRLMFTGTENEYGFYIYDASGERVAKQTGNMGQVNLNGSWWAQANPTNSIIYASPYVVCTPQGYTKHYYAGSERIASKTGGGGIIDLVKIVTELLTNAGIWKRTFEPLWTKRLRMLPPEARKEATCIGLYDLRKVKEKEKDIYYYHSDHLGSASWITNSDGRPVQHLQYLPFGELRIDQRAISWHSRYTFSGKEKDEESPYSYFGARYYDADLSIWTSVDPKSALHPMTNNYMYCLGNPLRFIDPNGEDEYEFDKKGNLINQKTNTEADIVRIVNRKGKEINSRTYEYGTINSAQERTLTNPIDNRTTFSSMVIDIRDGEKREDMFKFLAENTKVEWVTLSGSNATKEVRNKISTDHNDGSVQSGLALLFSDYMRQGFLSVDDIAHSHPKSFWQLDNRPSGYGGLFEVINGSYSGDRGVARFLDENFSGVVKTQRVYDARDRIWYIFTPISYKRQ